MLWMFLRTKRGHGYVTAADSASDGNGVYVAKPVIEHVAKATESNITEASAPILY